MDHRGRVARGPLDRRCRVRRRRRRRRRAANTPATGTARSPTGGKPGGKLTVLWAGDVDYVDCGQAYYQSGYIDLLRDAAPAVLVQARRRRQHGPGPRRGAARGLRGRQDRHGQDPQGRQVLAAGRPRGDLQGRQVRDGAHVLLDRRDRLLVLLRGHRRRRGRRQAGHEDRGHRDARTTRRSSSSLSKATRRRARLRRARACWPRRRSRRSTRRSSTRRRRRPTARTRSRRART